jgi:AraC-like DNA-binding protein
MIIQNTALYHDKYSLQINEENDTIFYSFDYDVRSADINMKFQHFHRFYELFVTLCPSAVHFIEGIPYEVQTFDIVGISPNRLHKTQYPEGRPCKRIIIQFNLPAHVTGLSNEYEQLVKIFERDVPIFRFGSELQKRLFSKLNDIYQLAPKTDPMRNLVIHQKFIEFLILLFLNQDANIYSNGAEMSISESKVYSVASYIHAHYQDDLSLEGLAQQFGISTSYLSHRFKAVTGFSVTDYVQMTRIRNAQALLINTNIPITEISEPCGFNCFSQFNRVFRKHIGMSPSTYRKKYQGQRSIVV